MKSFTMTFTKTAVLVASIFCAHGAFAAKTEKQFKALISRESGYDKVYFAYVDFSVRSSQPRFDIVETSTGKVIDSFVVAHGTNSDPHNTGLATIFSNVPEAKTSSLGRYRITGSRVSNSTGHGLTLDLVGLDPTNSNAKLRQIVVHAANYVEKPWLKRYGKPGRSWGCFALSAADRDRAAQMLKTGSLIIAENDPSLDNTALDQQRHDESIRK